MKWWSILKVFPFKSRNIRIHRKETNQGKHCTEALTVQTADVAWLVNSISKEYNIFAEFLVMQVQMNGVRVISPHFPEVSWLKLLAWMKVPQPQHNIGCAVYNQGYFPSRWFLMPWCAFITRCYICTDSQDLPSFPEEIMTRLPSSHHNASLFPRGSFLQQDFCYFLLSKLSWFFPDLAVTH